MALMKGGRSQCTFSTGWWALMPMSNCSGSHPKCSHAALQFPYKAPASCVWPEEAENSSSESQLTSGLLDQAPCWIKKLSRLSPSRESVLPRLYLTSCQREGVCTPRA